MSQIFFPPAASGSALNVVSKTGTYSATAGDYIYCSSASFTITLPTASGAVLPIYIEHAGTSLSQVYTVNTTGGQTVGGYASGALALYTAGEVFQLISDGSNWRIASHKASTVWTSYALTIGASTTPPTLGATVTVNQAYWRRVGANIEILYSNDTSGTGKANGSGTYLFPPPSNVTFDTTSAYATTTTLLGVVGQGRWGGASVGPDNAGCMVLYNSTNLAMTHNSAVSTAYVSSTDNIFGSTNPRFSFQASVPVSGWIP